MICLSCFFGKSDLCKYRKGNKKGGANPLKLLAYQRLKVSPSLDYHAPLRECILAGQVPTRSLKARKGLLCLRAIMLLLPFR